MDRGRQMDNAQNSNAVFIDRFNKSGKTSTKITHPPGGQDHFSLGWDNPQPSPQPQTQPQQPPSSNKPRIERRRQEQEPPKGKIMQQHPNTQQPPMGNQPQTGQHTSVRVNQRPGGNSNIIFGSDDSNYEHYRK